MERDRKFILLKHNLERQKVYPQKIHINNKMLTLENYIKSNKRLTH